MPSLPLWVPLWSARLVCAQKLCRRQLNTKVSIYESAILCLLSLFLVKTTMFKNDILKTVQILTVILSQNWCLSQHEALPLFIATNSRWSIKLFTAYPGCCPVRCIGCHFLTLCASHVINEFGCYEAKIEESEKGWQPPGVKPRGHLWLEARCS